MKQVLEILPLWYILVYIDMFIHDVCAALKAAGVPYAIVGGYAVALHGAVRGTVDVDVAIRWSLKNLQNAEQALKKLGLVSSIPIDARQVYHFREEYIQNRHLTAWNFYDPSHPLKQVDLIIAYDLAKRHTKTFHTDAGKICVLAKRDLIAMKRASGRPQDLEDVKALEAL